MTELLTTVGAAGGLEREGERLSVDDIPMLEGGSESVASEKQSLFHTAVRDGQV